MNTERFFTTRLILEEFLEIMLKFSLKAKKQVKSYLVLSADSQRPFGSAYVDKGFIKKLGNQDGMQL